MVRGVPCAPGEARPSVRHSTAVSFDYVGLEALQLRGEFSGAVVSRPQGHWTRHHERRLGVWQLQGLL